MDLEGIQAHTNKMFWLFFPARINSHVLKHIRITIDELDHPRPKFSILPTFFAQGSSWQAGDSWSTDAWKGSWWVFPKIGIGPKNGWFIMENPTKMNDLGGKPTIFGNIHVFVQRFSTSRFAECIKDMVWWMETTSPCIPGRFRDLSWVVKILFFASKI